MATRPTLRTRIAHLVGEVFTEGEVNNAINLAIEAAWPTIKGVAEDDTITLEAGTFIYDVGASDVTEKGVAQVHVERTGQPYKLLRRVQQRCVGGQWKLYFPTDTVSTHAGSKLHCFYHQPYPALDDDSTDTSVPASYVTFYAASVLCIDAMRKRGQYNVEGYRQAAPMWMELADREKKKYATPGLLVYVSTKE